MRDKFENPWVTNKSKLFENGWAETKKALLTQDPAKLANRKTIPWHEYNSRK